ncbi:hypothetical protein L7F22_015742, partial [Adiantum nelumboides]|nr:hypothetical protein [Adiantum nelumboides]
MGRGALGEAWGILRAGNCHEDEGLLDLLESSCEGLEGPSYDEEGPAIPKMFKKVQG